MHSLSPTEQKTVQAVLELVRCGRLEPPQAWQQLCRDVLRPAHPFDVHKSLHQQVYAGWDVAVRGPRPVWVPSPEDLVDCNLSAFMDGFRGDLRWVAGRTGSPAADWPLLQSVSWTNPEAFWAAWLQLAGVQFAVPPTRILQEDVTSPDASRWLPGARLNIAACALSCPRAPAGAPALVWAEEGAPAALRSLGLGELRQAAGHVAACIRQRFQPGDPLAINMPLTADAAVVYLACVLAGCPVVSIADSFAAEEVAARLHISAAKGVFTQDVVLRGGRALPLYARVKAADAPLAIVLPARGGGAAAGPGTCMPAVDPATVTSNAGAGGASTSGVASRDFGELLGSWGLGPGGGGGRQLREALRPGDMAWSEFVGLVAVGAGAAFPPHEADAYDTSNILFSSGTTGEPKAIPWTHLSPLRAAVDGWAHQDIHPGQVVCWPTNLGWMMGPWLLYAALLNGATVALYHGAPQGRDFGEFVGAARVSMLGLIPSIVKAWRASGCMEGLDWGALACFSSTGEASNADDYHWLASRVRGYRPVIEYCGGTEIGGGFLTATRLQPQAPATFSCPSIGSRLVLLGRGGEQLPDGQPCVGEVALEPPMLGSSQALLNRDHTATYYKDMPREQASGRPLRRHGDEVARLPGGYYVALGRCDDTMNLGGIKVASVELERVVAEHVPGVSEVAAVAAPSPGGGPELLHLFVVPGAGAAAPADTAALRAACSAALRQHLNPLFKVEGVAVLAALPRTASNKVMRRVLRDELMAAQAAAPRARL